MTKVTGIVVLFCLLSLDCAMHGNEEVRKVKVVLTESYAAMDRFIAALDQASDNAEIVSAIRNYEKDLDILMPKAKEVEETMQKINGVNPPKELTVIIERTKQLTGDFFTSYKKVFDHAGDPDVRKALVNMVQKNNEMPAIAVW